MKTAKDALNKNRHYYYAKILQIVGQPDLEFKWPPRTTVYYDFTQAFGDDLSFIIGSCFTNQLSEHANYTSLIWSKYSNAKTYVYNLRRKWKLAKSVRIQVEGLIYNFSWNFYLKPGVTPYSNATSSLPHEIPSEPPRWCGADDANGRCEDKCHF